MPRAVLPAAVRARHKNTPAVAGMGEYARAAPAAVLRAGVSSRGAVDGEFLRSPAAASRADKFIPSCEAARDGAGGG